MAVKKWDHLPPHTVENRSKEYGKRISYPFLALLFLTSCNAAPSRDILGSFFPAWMLCAVIGIIATTLVHKVFMKFGIDEVMPVKPLIYLLLTATMTFLIWLIWFGN